MSITLEAGKFYRTRDGRKVGPLLANSASLNPWPFVTDGEPLNAGEHNYWKADGRWNANGSESNLDLVAEWVDEPIKLSLEVGKAYQMRDGRRVVIHRESTEANFPYTHVGKIEGETRERVWTSEGFWDMPGSKNGFDIVAELIDEPGKPQAGDMVHVRMKVEEVSPSLGIRAELVGAMGRLYVRPEDIVHVEPRPIAAGDTVRYAPSNVVGRVLTLSDAYAWFQPVNQVEPYTVEISRLTRIVAID